MSQTASSGGVEHSICFQIERHSRRPTSDASQTQERKPYLVSFGVRLRNRHKLIRFMNYKAWLLCLGHEPGGGKRKREQSAHYLNDILRVFFRLWISCCRDICVVFILRSVINHGMRKDCSLNSKKLSTRIADCYSRPSL